MFLSKTFFLGSAVALRAVICVQSDSTQGGRARSPPIGDKLDYTTEERGELGPHGAPMWNS